MRYAIALVVLVTPALTHADGGASFDAGLVMSRLAVADETTVDATSVRFAIRIQPERIRSFHYGAEAEEGRLRGTTPLSSGAVPRTATGERTTTIGDESPLGGNSVALKLFVGVHKNVGALRVGADAAGGFRDTWVESDAGMDVAGRKNEPLLEVRSRVDYRLSSRLLIGATASTDVIEHRDVSLAVVLALDFTRE